jgi:Zn-finger nucleic acid-binding protein
MAVFELEGVEVDRCPTCGGTWLDAGELEILTRRSGASTERLARSLAAARELRRTRRRCPRCPRRLHEFALGEDPVVHLDRCPWGHGLWCDRGEMVTVVRSHAGDQDRMVAAFFADLYCDDIGSIEKGD